MSRFKNRLVKRVMAVILSGAMVMSCMPSSNMTAFASETPSDTGGGYFSEVEDVGREDDADIETAEKEDAVDDKSTNVSSKEETTSKNEDNVSSDKKDDNKDAEDTARETVAADKDDEADAVEDDKTSETKSSLSAEVEEDEPEEKDEKVEDVKGDTLLSMTLSSDTMYQFNAESIEAFASGAKQDGESVLLGDDYFALICGTTTNIQDNRNETFYPYVNEKFEATKITQRINMGGPVTTEKNAVKFITNKAADVTVYWVGGAEDNQMSILDADGNKVAETDEVTLKSGLYVSTMTLKSEGTYYLGGNNSIYKVVVSEEAQKQKLQEWDFRNTNQLPGSGVQVSKCAFDYYGLRIDTNNHAFASDGSTGGAKFTRNNNNAQVNKNTLIRIPVDGRSKITIQMYNKNNGGCYSLDGVASKYGTADGDKDDFFTGNRDGKAAYAVLKLTNGNYLNRIKVEPIKTLPVKCNVTLPNGAPSDLKLIFTEIAEGDSVHIAEVEISSEGTSTVNLYKGAKYEVSLNDKNYGVSEGGEISISETAESVSDLNITVKSMSLSNVEGTVSFPEDIPNNLKLTFAEVGGSHVVRDVSVTTENNVNKYTAELQPGKTYTVTAEGTGIKNFELKSDEITTSSPNIEFIAKTKYDVTINVTSFDEKITALPSAIIFANDSDGEEYTYKFSPEESIKLRDGTYSMRMEVPYPYMFDFSKKLTIQGANKELALNFTERMAWDFTNKNDIMLTAVSIERNKAEDQDYNGLKVNTANNGNISQTEIDSKGQIQLTSGATIKIPVSGKGTIQIVTPASDDKRYTKYKIDEKTTATEADATYKYDTEKTEEAEGFITLTDGYAILTSTDNNCYIKKIIVTRDKQQGGDDPEPITGSVAEGTIDFQKLEGLSQGDVPSIEGITLNNIKWWNSHGLVASNGSTMTLNLSKKAKLEVVLCCYGSGPMEASAGTLSEPIDTTEVDGEKIGKQYEITGVAAGALTLTFKGTAYIHNIKVTYDEDVVIPTGPRKIDVWDFGGKTETNTEKYANNITPEIWVSANSDGSVIDTTAKTPIFKKGESTFGDLTIRYEAGDRLYSETTTTNADFKKLLYGDKGNDSNYTYPDGYKADGAVYTAGDGTKEQRSITIKNVIAGDKIIVYAGQHSGNQDGPLIFYYEGGDTVKTQKGSVTIGPGRKFQKFEFIAECTGSYTIWPVRETSGNNGKAMYHRVMRIPGVKVSGTINFGAYTGNDYSVKFINQTTKQEFPVDVKADKSFELLLAPGYEYLAVLNGASGYGFAAPGKNLNIPADSDGISNVALVVEAKDMYAYSGNITGFATGYNTERISITMVPPKDSNADDVDLVINKDTLGFTANLESNLEYTIKMEGVDDYEIDGDSTVKADADYQHDIAVKPKQTFDVTGNFIGLKDGVTVTELKFVLLDEKNKEDDNYTYTATVADNGYSIKLRNGAYIAKATVSAEGYSTQSHVVVEDEAVSKDLIFVSADDTSALEWKSDLYVDKNDTAKYQTVTAAVKAAKRMSPSSEEKRITIHIAPGVYREQILVDVPYLTFKNDTPSEEVKLTWYYGIGYEYYSAKGGYYDEASAYDKYERYSVSDWGTTVRLNASNFRAENIIFENSFNQYITDEEIADGVQPTSTSGKPARTKGVDVASSNYKERAAVMYINGSADRAEFYRCSFISNQDTLGSGKAGTHAYFKECLIEGTTDYICGGGDCVFDECELRWAGQSDKPAGGYITAPNGTNNKGYLFRNCTITANKNRQVSAGYLGRPWGADAKAVFINTKLERADLVDAAGWNDMGGNLSTVLKDGGFKEYNTTFNGSPVNVSGRKDGTVADKAFADAIKIEDYFGGWEPVYYNSVEEPTTTETRTTVPKNTKIELSCTTQDAKIYYTITGEEPTESSIEYNAETGIVLDEITDEIIIKAIAVKNGKKSTTAVFTYKVVDPTNFVDMPTSSKPDGYQFEIGGGSIELDADPDADIYYIMSNKPITETPDSTSTHYTGPIKIAEETYIKAVAIKGGKSSDVLELHYDVQKESGIEPPTANPKSGSTVKVGETITLSSTVEDANIYYTTDGNDPTEKSALYETPIIIDEKIIVDETITIKAIAVTETGTSGIATFTYTIENGDASEKDPDDPGEDKSDIQITGIKKDGYDYTGAKIIPDIKVWDCDIKTNGKRLLEPGVDYTVAYKNNVNVGDKATVIVTGKGNYVGKDVTETFTIKEVTNATTDPKNLKGAKIAKISDETYDGTAHYPEFTLKFKDGTSATYAYDQELKRYKIKDNNEKAIDINVAVSNNINKGTATIYVSGEKDAKGKATSAKATFKILPIDLSTATIEATNGTYAVSGAVPASLKVKIGDKTLTKGIDYTVKYAKNKKAGQQGTVTITGKGNYTKKKTQNYGIDQLDLSKLEVSAVTACDGMKAGKVKATVLDQNGTALKASQYTVKIYTEAAETSTTEYDAATQLKAKDMIYVAVEAKDTTNLKDKTSKAAFKVGIDISKAKIALKKVNGKAATKEYTGNEIKLLPEEMEATIKVKGEASPRTLTMSDGKIVTDGEGTTDGEGITGDYIIVSYTNNINKGTATAVIKGINDYSGTKTIKFKITPQKMVKGTTTDASVNPVSNLINKFITKFAN